MPGTPGNKSGQEVNSILKLEHKTADGTVAGGWLGYSVTANLLELVMDGIAGGQWGEGVKDREREKEKRVPETDGGGVRPENNIYRQRICDITSPSLSDRIEAGFPCILKPFRYQISKSGSDWPYSHSSLPPSTVQFQPYALRLAMILMVRVEGLYLEFFCCLPPVKISPARHHTL